MILNYGYRGIDLVPNESSGGCGLAKDIRLYMNFSIHNFEDPTLFNPNLFMKQ